MTTLPIRIADSRNRRTFIGGSDARIIMGSDEGRSPASGARNEARPSLRTSPGISSSSLAS
jgi:predicted phage-related endonuclease